MADEFVPLKDPSLMTPEEMAAENAAIDAVRQDEQISQSPNLLTPEEIDADYGKFQEEQKYGDRPLEAGAAALASGLTFSGSDRFLDKTGLVDKETLAKLAEYNPEADITGQVTGAVIPAFLTGGASIPESALATGARTAIKLSPAALAARGGMAVEKAALKALGNAVAETGQKKLVQEIVKKSVAKSAGSAVEGAAWGANQLLREDALGKAELNAENLLGYTGEGGLVGGALGAALVPGGAVLKGVGGGLSKGLKKAGEKVANGKEDVVKFFGISPKVVQKQEQIFGKEDFKQTLLDWTRKNIITDAKSLTKGMDDIGADLERIQGSAVTRMDEAINGLDNLQSGQKLDPSVFRDIAKQLEDEFVTPNLGANEEIMRGQVEKVREIQRMLLKRAQGTPPKPNIKLDEYNVVENELEQLKGQHQAAQNALQKHEASGVAKTARAEAAAELETQHAGSAISSENRQTQLAAQIESAEQARQAATQKLQQAEASIFEHDLAIKVAKKAEIDATEQARLLAADAKAAKTAKSADATARLEAAHMAEKNRIVAAAEHARLKTAAPEIKKSLGALKKELSEAEKAAKKANSAMDTELTVAQKAASDSELARVQRLEAELNNGSYHEEAQKLRNQLDDLKPRLTAAEERANQVRAQVGDQVDVWRAEQSAYANRPITAKEMRELRIFLDDRASEFYKSGNEKAVSYAAYKARAEVNNALKNLFAKSGNQNVADKWKTANRDYQFTKILEKSTDAKAARAHSNLNLKDLVLGGVGAELFGGAGIGIAAANKFMNSDLKRKMVILSQIEKSSQKVGTRISEAVENFYKKAARPARLASSGILVRSALAQDKDEQKPKNKVEAFRNIQNNVVELAADPEKMYDRVIVSTHILAQGAPETARSMGETMNRAVRFLAMVAPKDARDTGMPTFESEYEPSSMELSKFERYMQVVDAPLSVLSDLENGTLTRDHVEALKAVYPNMYNEIRISALKLAQENSKSLTYSKKIQMGILLDIPTDSSLSPQFILQMQQNFVPPEERQSQMQANGVPSQGSLVPPTAGGAQTVDPASRQNTQTQNVAAKGVGG